MGKLEEDIKSLKETVEELKKSVNQIAFNVIRLMGTLEKGIKTSGATVSEEGISSVSVDLGPIEERIEKLDKSMVTKEDVEEIAAQLKKLSSDKIAKAEAMQERATNLLEKGMELVELEATLAEVKSLLEERILDSKEEEQKGD
ncbi:hypothetical protein ES705_24620 [subsurface metagenome]